MAVGIGFMVLYGFGWEGSKGQAMGVGGFIAILGLAFLINSIFESREHAASTLPAHPAPPAPETHLQDPH